MPLNTRKIVILNWKMEPGSERAAKTLFGLTKKLAKKQKKYSVIIAPPFIYIPFFKKSGLELAAQNLAHKEDGALTGGVSPGQIKNLGVNYAIIGHSEQRALGEKDKLINEKIRLALKHKIRPILCVGEKSKNSKKASLDFISEQLKNGLKKIISEKNRIIIAYEPIWAISTSGTGNFCSANDANKIILQIKKIVSRLGFKNNKVLYGGSVNGKTAKDYLNKPYIDGILVGDASLSAKELERILQ